jgi:hypothetical protein
LVQPLTSGQGGSFNFLLGWVYEDVANNQTTPVSFSMKIEPYEAQVDCYLNILFSQTLLVFYFPILVLLLALSVVFYLS